MKSKRVSSLKKKAWILCSEYNRRKDADWKGEVKCVTCGKRMHWTEGDAGHYEPGRNNSILFYDNGIHFQCKPCNAGFRNQKLSSKEVSISYDKYMKKRYGAGEVKKIKKLKIPTKTFTPKELEDLIQAYQAKLKEL